MDPLAFHSSVSKRDVRIDWMRGLAMMCVIINHSKLSSMLSWFTYERLWVVTAAEVFVVLSGVVLGMVYGRRLARDGWPRVVRGLGQRAALLYCTFVGVTVSVLALAALGVDVKALAASDGSSPAWFVSPEAMNPAAWRDVILMRVGPWAFEIIGLYVWLVAAALPCLFILRYAGWRPLLAFSWALYLLYRANPHSLTAAEFESAFPILAWQLLFVHGIAAGYHRDSLAAFAGRIPAIVPRLAVVALIGFAVFACCNPWADGPAWLQAQLVSAERFASVYARYFGLSDLRVGRLINLAIGLPLGLAALTRLSVIARPFERVFVTLGQRSLGAFVLHVYGLLLLAQLPRPEGVVASTVIQLTLIAAIVLLLNGPGILAARQRPTTLAPARLAA